MNLEKIKQRDRWSCRKCGQRFDVSVLCFGSGYVEDDYITLCKNCLNWAIENSNEAVHLFRGLLLKNKVVLIGDCHGELGRIDQILSAEEPFDFFISVGDVAAEKDLTFDNINIINKWENKGYFVYGNHDEIKTFTPLELSQDINGIHVAGLNGILKSRNFIKDSPNNISFREILYLSHLNNVDILVTHQPPTSVFDRIGEPVLEELLNYLVPRIYVFGHVHRFKLKFHLNTFVISLPLVTKGHVVAHFQGKDLRNLEIVLKKGKRFVRV